MRETQSPDLQGRRRLEVDLGGGLRVYRPVPLARFERPGPPARRSRRDPVGEPPGVGDGRLRDPLRRRLVGPDLPDAPGWPDRPAAQRLRGEGDLRLDPRAARQDPDDQGPMPDSRPRDPDRGQPTRRARVHDLPRGGGPRPGDARDEPGRLCSAGRAGQARGRRDDHLHLGDDGRAQGRDADPLEPRLERRHGLRRHPVHGGLDRPLLPPALPRLRADARLRVPLQDGVDRLRGVHRQARREFPGGQSLLLRRRAAGLREGARPDHGEGGRRKPAQEEDLRVGRGRGARARPVHHRRPAAAVGPRAEGEDRRRPGLQEDPPRPRGELPLRGLGRRAALEGPRRVLRRRRRPDLRGLRPDRDLAGHHRQRAGTVATGHRRKAAPGSRGQDRARTARS